MEAKETSHPSALKKRAGGGAKLTRVRTILLTNEPLPLFCKERTTKNMARNWLHTKTRAELRQTMGWGDPPVVSSKDNFSAHHPMIPRRYVPAWQLDMQNRRNIIKNCELAGNSTWSGHISYFLNGRERLSVTRPVLYSGVLNYSRTLNKASSPFSRYNSSVMAMTS